MMESTKKLGQHEDFERRKQFLQIADLLIGKFRDIFTVRA